MTPVVDHSNMRLGKRAAVHNMSLPMLAAYTGSLPDAPIRANWSKDQTSWSMMANDRLGDCTAAGVGHAVQTWTQYSGTEFTAPDADAIKFYSNTCGYNPGDPNSDQGGVEMDVLTWWQKNDFCSHKLDAFAAIQPANKADVCDAIWLMGGIYLGLELPISCQSQTIWTVPASGAVGEGAPGSWGGHCVWGLSYGTRGIMFVTWGGVKLMGWDFFGAYCSEGYALLSKDWMLATGAAPSGFKYDDLIADMAYFK